MAGSLRSADLVPAEVAVQLGLPRSGGQSYEDALTRWLTERDVLLVIDNCEHVVSAVADLVEALTGRLPRLRVLATSREPLWIDGEVTYRIAPLVVVGPDASIEEIAASTAVQLFRERAGARALGPVVTERTCRLFGEICRRVDGLPLAIELAAARVAGLDPGDIASNLDDLFTLLPQPARRPDGAQRSLRATVEWSDALLTEEERSLLRRMGVFAGRFDLGVVKEVCAIDGQTAARVADLTARLVEKSLLLKALPIAQAIRDEATARQIAELLSQTSRVEPSQSATLRPEGGVWHIAFNGTSVHVPDMKGLWHLRELVSRPRAPVLALSLVAAPTEDPVPVGGAGPMLDREALRRYRKRLADLDEELEDAQAKHDAARHAKHSTEREALLKELARATGLGGKPRRTGSPTEKARVNVTRTIRHAITYLSTVLPELAAHLEGAVATGVSCCYEPRTNIVWTT